MNQHYKDKLVATNEAQQILTQWKSEDLSIVFTNGCFDLLHPGHIRLLDQARQLGDRLVIGLNSDASVRRLKGKNRPINDEQTRAILLSALGMVDLVVIFEEDTPLSLITSLAPNILVKGGDWKKDQIVGSDFVASKGGQVFSLPFLEGYSSTNLINRIKRQSDT